MSFPGNAGPSQLDLRGRLLQGLGSQGLSSISNFALVVAVARTSSAREFGAFSIAYSMALVVILITRASVGETLAITGGQRSRDALGGSLVLGLAASGAFLALGVIWPDPLLGRWLLLFAAGVPLLVLQDGVRHVGFAWHRPQLATATDGAWLGLQFGFWAVLVASDRGEPAALLIGWWAASGLAAAVLLPTVGRPALLAGVGWLRERRRLAASLGAEAALYQAGSQGTVYALGLVAGLPAAGALRGAQSLYGPVRSIASGIGSVALPEAVARLDRLGSPAMMRYAVMVSVWLSVVATAAVGLFLLAGDIVGRSLLGSTWPIARQVVPAVGLTVLGGVLASGPRLVLRALHATSWLLRLRAVATAMSISLGVGGAVFGGLLPAAYGLAAAQLATAALSWLVAARVAQLPEGT